jgi:uncharacterized protein (UPF0262 family)
MTSHTTQHIATITLDESSIKRRTPELEHERVVAMNDLIEWNHFAVEGAEGPYDVTLSTSENRIAFKIKSPSLAKPLTIALALTSLRGVIRDYTLICESYFEAVKSGNLPKIEAIDMSRRGLHNEGSDMLTGLLEDKVTLDSETSRRLFTLIYVLHLK